MTYPSAEPLPFSPVGQLHRRWETETGAGVDVSEVFTCHACACLVAEDARQAHVEWHNEIAAALNEALGYP